MLSSTNGIRFLIAAFAFAISLALLGCVDQTVSTDRSKESSHPYFAFHRPEEIKAAVGRIRELHDTITSSQPLPEPIAYQVKEVIHGSGPGKHSHYYLHDPANEDSAQHDDHDGHVTTGENIHDVTVEPLAELKDLIRWLPKIASNGDMPESQWEKFNQISKELAPQLIEIVKQSDDNEKQRVVYKKIAESLESKISTLEKLVLEEVAN